MKNCLTCLFLILVWTSCTKSGGGDPDPNPPPINNPPGPDDIQITSVDRTYGYTDDIIQIIARNFGTDINAVTAKVNNVTATILPVSFGTLGFSIKVPAKCGTGAITIAKGGKTATGPQFFYVPSVTVTTVYGVQNASGVANGSMPGMRLGQPIDFVFDKNNNIYIADKGQTSMAPRKSIVRKISAAGVISTFSGGPLGGTTSNDNTYWSVGLPAGSGGNSDVNGGNARFDLVYGINISEDPGSNAFKLFVTQNHFIRIINEATATGVYAGVLKDSVGGGGTPKEGGRHEAHINPLDAPVIIPNNLDYGSPTIYWIDAGPRIAKQDVNGNISTVVNITGGGGWLSKHPDGNLYFHGTAGTKKIFKVIPSGGLSTYIDAGDSLLNRASGKKEAFGSGVESSQIACMTIDKNGNFFLMTQSSAHTMLTEIFPDKSFIRYYDWYSKNLPTVPDGVNDHADIVDPNRIILRDNGDIYILDGFAIRKLTLE